jgi:nucleotide-binding universal stress UspA family protein
MSTPETRQSSARQVFLMVDGSAHARGALHLIGSLPLPPESQVVVLGVLSPGKTPGRAELMAALDAAEAHLRDRDIRVRTALLHGHPAAALVDYASRYTPDLVVVGAQGLHTTLGILLGGVAQQIVEYAPWPVLVSRGLYLGLQRILLATDGSSASVEAARYLAQLPLPASIEVHVVHVLPPAEQPVLVSAAQALGARIAEAPQGNASEPEALATADPGEGYGIVVEAAEVLGAADLRARGVLLRGNAAAELMAYANTRNIDLIVAGSRGLSKVQGWLLGSVSRKLVHYAGCSVLLVKSPA